MAWRFALMIDPADSATSDADFTSTFHEVDVSEPALRVGELSTQRGDGIFETIGVVDGHPQEVTAHLERLAHSAKLCDLPQPNIEQWRQAVRVAAQHCPPGEASIRLILSRGVEHGPTPTAWATAAVAPDNTDVRIRGVRVVTLDRGIDSGAAARAPWLLLGAKTLSYAVNMAAIREARRRGADDALFVSSDGIVLEAPTSTLLLRLDGVYVTPAPTGTILHGTTQLSVFEWLEAEGLPTEYREVVTADLARAEAAWLLSSVRLATPITALDGTHVAVDADLSARMNAYLLTPRS